MISLTEYIIKEQIDENIFWLLDRWFDNKDDEQREFIELLTRYNTENKKSKKDIEELIKGTALEKNLVQFINFIDNDVKITQSNKDYIYNLKLILDTVIGNKSKDNKFKPV